MVGYGYTMCIASRILKHVFRTTEGRLGIDDSVLSGVCRSDDDVVDEQSRTSRFQMNAAGVAELVNDNETPLIRI
jgi:hypothetical protein